MVVLCGVPYETKKHQLFRVFLGVFSRGESRKTTACDIAAKQYSMSAEHIYKTIWTPNKDSEEVKMHIEIGVNNKQFLDLYDVGI